MYELDKKKFGAFVAELRKENGYTQKELAETMEAEQVEDIVKTAISFKEEKPLRAYHVKSHWPKIYVLALLIGCIGMVFNYKIGPVDPSVFVAVPIGAAFGAYFCFLVLLKLPRMYDENKISIYYDYGVRMNMIGLYFNNNNWPYLVLMYRIWSCSTMAVIPWLFLLMRILLPNVWSVISLWVFLALVLGGMFVPAYIVGKKYE